MTEEKNAVHIQMPDGPIYGYVEERQGRKYYNFKGIPYAQPPVGRLRFLAAPPITPWTEPKDCTKEPETSWGLHMHCIPEYTGSEDCLYINIFTPNIKPDKPLPVMFWLSTYLYTYCMDQVLDPSLLLNEGVIFVRCGFRLGPFGFLSINDCAAPGNAGLKDLAMALRWVQRNISSFGGDPNNITLFGHSSGAALVHMLVISPMTSRLFHKAIIQSGSILNNWVLDKNPTKTVMELAKLLGITAESHVEVLDILKTLPPEQIMDATMNMMQKDITINNIFDGAFKPCIEEEYEGQPAFLTKSPESILKSGSFNHVPIIFGSVNIEGSLLQFMNSELLDHEYSEMSRLLVPKSLSGHMNISKGIGQQLMKFYMEGIITKDTRTQYIQLISDYYFLYYVNKSVRLHAKSAPKGSVYYYILNYAGDWVVPDDLKFFNATSHCADIPFIFPLLLNSREPCKGGRDAVRMREKVVRMWTNFAKYNNPTPDDDDPLLQITWDPVENENKLNYLSLAPDLTKGRNPFYERMKFWSEINSENAFVRAINHINAMGINW